MNDRPIDTKLEAKLGFDRIRATVADRCSTEYASQKALSEPFLTDREAIRKKLLLTDEMRLVVMFEENFPMNGYVDCLPFLTPLLKDGYNIDLLSIGKLRTMLQTVRKVTFFFSTIKDSIYPNLKKMASDVSYFPEVQRRIDNILDKYGEIRDNASEQLSTIRKSLRDKEASISKRAAAILRKAQEEGLVDSDSGISIRDGKYLVPVSTANKRKISGFIYDESASGKTTFVEPAEIVEMENEVSELRFAETKEIARILSEFSDFLRPYVPDLIQEATFLGDLDFIIAKAQTALDFIAGMPVISENSEMNLRKARHPLLEKALHKEGKKIVPVSISLTHQKHLLLISGPNAGGKSVCLKTTGLLQYMFQCGMLIPTSETSELPVFDRIMLSIGDDQSIDNDLSTYSSFLADMKQVLAEASDEKTLVLIDEFGSGTEPAAGGAIAEAILSELDRRGVFGIITTHYTNLKLYASASDCGVINGAMMFDARNIAPLFKLEIGLPGNSFAFELARKMGLPESLVKDAEERAGEEFVGIERNLRKIARNRKALDEKLQKIKNTDKALESIADKYEKELLEIKQQKKDILEEAKREAEEIVRCANRQVENTIRVIKETQAGKEQTKEARKELQNFMSALQLKKEGEQKTRDEYLDRKLDQLARRKEREEKRRERRNHGIPSATVPETESITRQGPFKVGEKVKVKDNGMVGEISCLSGKTVTITVGSISTKIHIDRLERISSNEYKAATKDIERIGIQKVDASLTDRKLNFKPEIDLRGERLNDAIETVMHYVDDAIMLNMSSVRIIHGKGTGVLRDEIQKFLKTVPGVRAIRDEHIQLGGTGVTVVDFE